MTDIGLLGKATGHEETIHQVTIPGGSHLLPDEIGTLLHHIFSGKDTKSVLVSYGITSPEAESFVIPYISGFAALPSFAMQFVHSRKSPL